MKKRILAFLLAVSIAVSVLVLPVSAASINNTALQTAITLGAVPTGQELGANVTRGAFAKMLVSFSTYRESVDAQGTVGTLYRDVPGTSQWAPYIRIAVQQGWMNGYTDGSFRPDNTVTLEEACAAVLKLLSYKTTDLTGSFPQAQLNKAQQIGLRDQLTCTQGQAMTYEQCTLLLYNALRANTASGSAYGSSLGFTVSNGQVDTSSVLLKSRKGPFVAEEGTQLPFTPVSVYRNDKTSASAELNKYDVYYYSESLQTAWIYTRRAAGRITAVSPSASAPTSVTVAGTSYTIASSSAAAQLSSLNGGGVLGHQAIADANNDGYTIGMITFELATYKKLGTSDLTWENYAPLCRVNTDAAAITVGAKWAASNNITDLAGFIDYCKSCGYILCAMVLSMIIMILIGKRNWLQMILVSVLVPLLMWLVFYKVLTVNIPLGPLNFLRTLVDMI
mgnify:CR=1 FL=1